MASDPLDSRASTPAEELYFEYELKLDSGKAPDFEAYCRAHSEHAEELSRLHARALGHRELERAGVLEALPRVMSHDRASLDAMFADLRLVGAPKSRYRIGDELGRGGMGVVHEAEDTLLERKVALKLISSKLSSAALLPQFRREMRLAARISHPGVAGIHDAGVDEVGRVFFAMPLVRGRDLSEVFELVQRGDPEWTQAHALGVLRQVCDTMAYVHGQGIIHRDLKPSNIRVGDFGEVFVMDWGLAKEIVRDEDVDAIQAAAVPVAGSLSAGTKGTPVYMSPEQARGDTAEIGPPTDIYAIGAMLYELVAGHAPYRERGEAPDNEREMRRVRAGPPRALETEAKDAPAELVAIAEKGMARDPADRYRNMRELGSDLRFFLELRPVRAHKVGPLVELEKWIRRNRLAAAGLVGTVLTAIVGASAYTWQQTLASKKLAQTSLDNALYAGQHGGWHDALECIRRAREAKYNDPLELDLLEAEALIATGRTMKARTMLTAIQLARATSPQRGRVHLALGQLEQTPAGSVDAAMAHFRAALKEELTSANQAYARGMIADRTQDSLASFEEALSKEPFHPAARNAQATTLFFLGRHQEARARADIQAELFPDSVEPRVVIALIDAATGSADAAERRFKELEPVLGSETVRGLRLWGEQLGELNSLPVSGIVGFPAELTSAGDSWGDRIQLIDGARYLPVVDADTGVSIPFPRVASVAAANEVLHRILSPPHDTLAEEDVPLVKDPARCAVELEHVLEKHEDGLFHLLRGLALLTSDLETGETQADKLRRSLPSFERGMSVPSIVPKLSHMARVLAAHCYNDLIAYYQGSDLVPHAVAAIRDLRIDSLTDWDEVTLLGSLAMSSGIQSEGLRLVDDWIELHPDDLDARAARLNCLRMLGSLPYGLAEADKLLAEHPGNQKLLEAREKLEAELRKIEPGSHPGR